MLVCVWVGGWVGGYLCVCVCVWVFGCDIFSHVLQIVMTTLWTLVRKCVQSPSIKAALVCTHLKEDVLICVAHCNPYHLEPTICEHSAYWRGMLCACVGGGGGWCVCVCLFVYADT